MKKQFLFLLFIAAVLLTSCNFDGDSNYTPSIQFIAYPYTQNGDTLNIKTTGESGVYLLDSIQVGDTVFFQLGLNAYTNNLVSFRLTKSVDSAGDFLFPPVASLDSIFSHTNSDYGQGKFVFLSGFNAVYFPFHFAAKSATNDEILQFSLVSDAQFDDVYGSNVTSFKLKMPIKPAAVVEE
jgi:hypothetical protein